MMGVHSRDHIILVIPILRYREKPAAWSFESIIPSKLHYKGGQPYLHETAHALLKQELVSLL